MIYTTVLKRFRAQKLRSSRLELTALRQKMASAVIVSSVVGEGGGGEGGREKCPAYIVPPFCCHRRARNPRCM